MNIHNKTFISLNVLNLPLWTSFFSSATSLYKGGRFESFINKKTFILEAQVFQSVLFKKYFPINLDFFKELIVFSYLEYKEVLGLPDIV